MSTQCSMGVGAYILIRARWACVLRTPINPGESGQRTSAPRLDRNPCAWDWSSQRFSKTARAGGGRAPVIVSADYSALVHKERALAGLAVFTRRGHRLKLIAHHCHFKVVSVLIEHVFLHQLLRDQFVERAVLTFTRR